MELVPPALELITSLNEILKEYRAKEARRKEENAQRANRHVEQVPTCTEDWDGDGDVCPCQDNATILGDKTD